MSFVGATLDTPATRMSERPTSWQADAQSDSDLAERLTRLFKRSVEELYALESDEFQMKTPAGRPEFVALKARLRRELDARIRSRTTKGRRPI